MRNKSINLYDIKSKTKKLHISLVFFFKLLNNSFYAFFLAYFDKYSSQLKTKILHKLHTIEGKTHFPFKLSTNTYSHRRTRT